jgi:hypothetical protein
MAPMVKEPIDTTLASPVPKLKFEVFSLNEPSLEVR